jgi:hypothetical protein
MDRSAARRRLRQAGLGEAKADVLVELLWNVHETGQTREVDFAHLSDVGFRHLDVCVMRELLIAALSRRRTASPAVPAGDASVMELIGAFDGKAESDKAD